MTTQAEASPISGISEETASIDTTDVVTQDVAADPSTADAKEAPAVSLLDVVKNVLEPKEAQEPEAPSAPAAEKQPTETEALAPQELSAEDLAKLPFNNHPRFREILEQRNALKADLAERDAKLEALIEPAEQWGSVRTFMEDNQLSDQDMLDGFRMMAMVRMNPLEGRAAIANYLGELDQALGLVLPEDLREDVDLGMIAEERAYELARARATTQAYTAQSQTQALEQQQAYEARAQQDYANGLMSAATEWEAQARSRDPDFEAKQDLIADRMRAISMAERVTPRTPEEMTHLLDRAHADVTGHLRRFVPRPSAVARPTSASPASVATPAPKTLREALALAARG